ncbi:hypothetical protein R3P38DRAFT_3217789 [Favolaschia claudopus]|uniref:Uncharacterized protein n=1 Tax=Favolaschia claudopus TaxID=2862362 RepID=A0AAW0A4N0_9AGAR
MDLGAHFDREAAMHALDNLIQRRATEDVAAFKESFQYFSQMNLDNIVVHEASRLESSRREWKLAAMSTNGAVEEEVTFRVHGVLAKVNLVPGNITHLNGQKASTLSQRVQLVGLGSSAFDEMLMNTKVVADLLRRYFGGQQSISWRIGEDFGDLQFNCSCLYLTKSINRPEQEIAFGPGVDPFKKFEKFRNQGYIHTALNVVKYFRRVRENDELALYECFPGTFRVGDIVEVQGSVVAFPIKDGIMKVAFRMNALTLEDATYSKAAEHARTRQLAPTVHRPLPLKRKSWYEQEGEDAGVGITRRKFKDMRLGDAISTDRGAGEKK